jgi:hypothetical protein
MIAIAQTFATPEVGSTAMMETSDRVDSTLLEQIDLVPRTHVPIGEHDVAWTQDIPQLTQHPQLTVPLA